MNQESNKAAIFQRDSYSVAAKLPVATFVVLLLSLVVNLLVLVQNWSLKSRVYRLESAVFGETTKPTRLPPISPTKSKM